MAKVIMVQGTMSGVGKSLICAGLCRIFVNDGFRVFPFKSQNMALNSYITDEGLEMGRAQAMQAEAAKVKPMALFNPVLLKPTGDTVSQVVVNGEVIGNMSAKDYFSYKNKLVPEIKKAFLKLNKMADIIVIEGAGSPAEINLKENDIVNMGLAKLVDAPVLLVGDIDRGGVFAQLLGTLMLLTESERKRVKGLIINKFRGDKTILLPGIDMIEDMGKVRVAGLVPYMDISLEDEDSLTGRFDKRETGLIDMAVIRYPRISNFTDFDVFEQSNDVAIRYVTSVNELGNPDIIFLPGSKNTIGDLKWMRENGLEAAVKKKSEKIIIFGICGGYQMLGNLISDPYSAEEGGEVRGMELLPIRTVLKKEKVRKQNSGVLENIGGILSCLNGKRVSGYEIHMGDSIILEGCDMKDNCTHYCNKQINEVKENGSRMVFSKGNVYGTYLHGIFDEAGIAPELVKALALKKGVKCAAGEMISYAGFKETQYEKLAAVLRESLDMEFIYGILNEAAMQP